MQVFISWSGELSKGVALALREWLPTMFLERVVPFYSEQDIESGLRWSDALALKLEEMSFGIICVTRDNAEKPWINYEAGALAKVRSVSKVVPFLIDIEPSGVDGPLGQFQARRANRDNVWLIISELNKLIDHPISEGILEEQFDALWPKLSTRIDTAISEHPTSGENLSKKRSERDILEEILELARSQQRSVEAPLGSGFTATVTPREMTEIAEAWRVLSAYRHGVHLSEYQINTAVRILDPVMKRLLGKGYPEPLLDWYLDPENRDDFEPGQPVPRIGAAKAFLNEVSELVGHLAVSGTFEVERGDSSMPWDFRITFQQPEPRVFIVASYRFTKPTGYLPSTRLRNLAAIVAIEGYDEAIVVSNEIPRQASITLADRLTATVGKVSIMPLIEFSEFMHSLIIEATQSTSSEP